MASNKATGITTMGFIGFLILILRRGNEHSYFEVGRSTYDGWNGF